MTDAGALKFIENIRAAMKLGDRPDLLNEFWAVGDHWWPDAIERAIKAEADYDALVAVTRQCVEALQAYRHNHVFCDHDIQADAAIAAAKEFIK